MSAPRSEQPSHRELVEPYRQCEVVDVDALVPVVIARLHDLGGRGPERAEAVGDRPGGRAQIDRVGEARVDRRQAAPRPDRSRRGTPGRCHRADRRPATRCPRRAPRVAPAHSARRCRSPRAPAPPPRPRSCRAGCGSRARRWPGPASRCACSIRATSSAPSLSRRGRGSDGSAPDAAQRPLRPLRRSRRRSSPTNTRSMWSTYSFGCDRGHACADAPQDLGEQRHSVLALARHRCVTCLPQRDDPHRERPAVADGQRHDDTPVGQLETHPLALVECVVRPDVGRVARAASACRRRRCRPPRRRPRGTTGHRSGGTPTARAARAPRPGLRPRSSCRPHRGRRDSRRRRRPRRTAGASSPGRRTVRRRCVPRVPWRVRCHCRGAGRRGSPAAGRAPRSRTPPRPARDSPGGASPRPSHRRAGSSCRAGSARGRGRRPRCHRRWRQDPQSSRFDILS